MPTFNSIREFYVWQPHNFFLYAIVEKNKRKRVNKYTAQDQSPFLPQITLNIYWAPLVFYRKCIPFFRLCRAWDAHIVLLLTKAMGAMPQYLLYVFNILALARLLACRGRRRGEDRLNSPNTAGALLLLMTLFAYKCSKSPCVCVCVNGLRLFWLSGMHI